ncbi:MAG: PAS domain S-box protein [Thermodesulfobacteriota bacterium]|nr:PAS domain S-box protein [Thermodesulfobacteriota bacterium]
MAKGRRKLCDLGIDCQEILDNVKDGVYLLDSEGYFRYVNKVIEKRSGISADKFCKLHFLDVVIPEDHDRVKKNFERVMAGEEVHPYELTYKNAEGDGLTVKVNTKALYRDSQVVGLQGISRDITGLRDAEDAFLQAHKELEERVAKRTSALAELNVQLQKEIRDHRGTEEALRESEGMLSGIVAGVTDQMTTMDKEYNIIWANDMAREAFGDDLVGQKCFQALHGYGKPCHPCVVKQCFEDGEPHEGETEVTGNDGVKKIFWCTASAGEKDGDGPPKTVVKIFRDITEWRASERKLAAYNERLRAMASQVSLAEERERRRLAGQVHDFVGQNLALMKIKMGVLRKNVDSGLGMLAGEMTTLLDQTIDTIRSITFELGSPELYELGLVPAIKTLVQGSERIYGIKARFEGDGEPLGGLKEDLQVSLFLAVRELLLNISKHAKAKRASVKVTRGEDGVKVEVVDNGAGFHVSGVNSAFYASSGYGLFSIQQRLEALGGVVSIASELGRGTCVTLSAPLGPDASEDL